MPEKIKLMYAHLVPEIWEGLAGVLRTGWVMRGVPNPENVQEHTIALKKLAVELADHLTDFSEEEKSDLLDMLEIHDWSEAIVGDEVIHTYNGEEREKRKLIKFEKEKKCMEELCAPLGEAGQRILELWNRFEVSEDGVASFARQLDRLQAVEKAFEYENEHNIPLFAEFSTSAQKSISHEILLKRVALLTNQHEIKVLGALAEKTIIQLEKSPQPIVRVCGPLTTGGFGYAENASRLEQAEETLADKGMTVFRFGDAEKEIQGKGYAHEAVMNYFHKPILASGLIATTYFLPKWEESKGACIERELATQYGIEIKDL